MLSSYDNTLDTWIGGDNDSSGYYFDYDDNGKIVRLKKVLSSSILDNIYFELRCYELSVDYYTNNWDVTEDDLASEVYQDDIKGIESLEVELSNYIQDFSILKPEWECDNLL